MPAQSQQPDRTAAPARSPAPALAPPGDFDLAAVCAALDDQRRARGLSWQQVTREINGFFEGVRPARPVSSSTLTAMARRSSVEGNVMLLVLRWLGRTPESFVPSHPAPTTPATMLPQ